MPRFGLYLSENTQAELERLKNYLGNESVSTFFARMVKNELQAIKDVVMTDKTTMTFVVMFCEKHWEIEVPSGSTSDYVEMEARQQLIDLLQRGEGAFIAWPKGE